MPPFISHVYNLATISTYHSKIPRGLPFAFFSVSSCYFQTSIQLTVVTGGRLNNGLFKAVLAEVGAKKDIKKTRSYLPSIKTHKQKMCVANETVG